MKTAHMLSATKKVVPTQRLLFRLALGAAFCVVVSPARAEEEFPPIVQQELGMPCAPTCLLCHSSLSGGTATLYNEGFWLNLVTVNGWNRTAAGLPAALEAAAASKTDSDQDGTDDITELKAGHNPQAASAESFCESDAPVYGCGAQIVPALRPALRPAFACGLLLALVTLLARRRTRTTFTDRAE